MTDFSQFDPDSSIQKKFDEIEEILRDEAHEGIDEALHDLHNMVTLLEIRMANLQNIMNARFSALKSDE